MLTKTKVALAAVLILGTASAALAKDDNDGPGGFVIPGSTDGVNPAYHPEWFPNHANTGKGGNDYGFVPAAKQTHRPSHERTQDR